MKTELSNAMAVAGDKAQYDIRAKRLLAQKSILARILLKTVDAFKGMSPEDVADSIEGEPVIGMVPIEPGSTNAERTDGSVQRIRGFNTENSEINEGMIRFDIVFYVRLPFGNVHIKDNVRLTENETNHKLTQIIVNVEAQKDEPAAYKILNRSIFYVSRLVSSQKERDFVNSNYDDIKQVYSIWICMNMKCNSMSHIHLTKDEKLEIMEKEYNLPLNSDFRRDVNVMCNLSDGIEEKAAEKATEKTTREINEKVIKNMHKNGYTAAQIAEIVEVSELEVEAVIKECKIV